MTRSVRAAVFTEPGRPLEIREFPMPEPQGAEVLVNVIACTLCGSDLHTLHGRRNTPLPTILGHEILGRVAAFGPNAPSHDASGQPLHLGDRVTWSVVANCGECFYCQRSLPQKCERQTKYGHEPLRPGRELTGGLSEVCLLAPGTAIYVVPPELPDAVACPANCATATVAAAMNAPGDENVLVMGAGMLGVAAIAWTNRGAEQVIACDADPNRLDLAGEFGATCVSLPADLPDIVKVKTGGYGVDVAYELTGSPEAFEMLLPQVRLGGTIVLVGSVFPSRPIPLLLEQVVRRCLTLRGLHNYAPPDLHSALSFLEAHFRYYPFEALVSEWIPLEDLNRVLALPPKSDKLRIGVRPGMSANA